MDPFKRGDFVDITVDDRTLPGMVTLASPCGKSLIVMFDGMLDGHVAAMPVLQEGEGFIALMTGKPVALQRKTR